MNTSDNDRDFRQLAGRFDSPVTPSLRFTEQLRQQVLATETNSIERGDAIGSVSEARRQPIGFPGFAAAPGRRWRLSPSIRIAAAILLLVTSVSAIALYRQPEEMQQLAFQPNTPAAPTEFNFGGDPGLTQDLGPVVPEMLHAQQRATIPTSYDHLSGITLTGNVDGNSIFFTDLDRRRDHAFIRYDLERQEIAWERPLWVSGTIGSDGQNVYVVAGDPEIGVQDSQLFSLDIATGETVWEGPKLANRPYMTASVTVAGSTVFAADFVGNVVSVNTADGSVNWQSPTPLRAPTPAESAGVESYFPWPQLPVNDAYVYVTRPDKTITQLDRKTGEEVGRLLVGEFSADVQSVELMANDRILVVEASSKPLLTDEATSTFVYPGEYLIVDPETLEVMYSLFDSTIDGNLAMHGDTIYTASRPSYTDQVEILAIDATTGAIEQRLIGLSETGYTQLSISGGILMATGDPSGIWFFDLATGQQVGHVELGIDNMETPFQMPIQMWDSKPLVITVTGEVYIFTDEAPKPGVATPAA